ncbi:MAG: hypothetical protein OXU51_16605 [Candidatus Poribacteria bacterium]|nr:hypothetical protein [Candidatus Poribacteria bacterium]
MEDWKGGRVEDWKGGGAEGWKIGWGEGGTVHRLNCDFCDSMIDRIIDRIGQPQGLPLQSKFIRKERGLVKPNFIRPLGDVALQTKSVGFHSVSGGCGVSGEKFVFL